MRSLVSRLARLERTESRARRRVIMRYGHVKSLPADYRGPRHIVAVRQIPPEELPPASRGQDWFELEERPGPEPPAEPRGPNDDIVLQVCFIDSKGPPGRLNFPVKAT